MVGAAAQFALFTEITVFLNVVTGSSPCIRLWDLCGSSAEYTETVILRSNIFGKWRVNLNKRELLAQSFGSHRLGFWIKGWPKQKYGTLPSPQLGCGPQLTSIGHQPQVFHGRPWSCGRNREAIGWWMVRSKEDKLEVSARVYCCSGPGLGRCFHHSRFFWSLGFTHSVISSHTPV